MSNFKIEKPHFLPLSSKPLPNKGLVVSTLPLIFIISSSQTVTKSRTLSIYQSLKITTQPNTRSLNAIFFQF